MTNQLAEEAQLEAVENQYWIDQAQALKRLEKNEDFRKVILDGYFKDRAVDGVSLLANEGIKKSGRRPDVMEQLVAISQLQDHFITIKNLGGIAQEDLEDMEELARVGE